MILSKQKDIKRLQMMIKEKQRTKLKTFTNTRGTFQNKIHSGETDSQINLDQTENQRRQVRNDRGGFLCGPGGMMTTSSYFSSKL